MRTERRVRISCKRRLALLSFLIVSAGLFGVLPALLSFISSLGLLGLWLLGGGILRLLKLVRMIGVLIDARRWRVDHGGLLLHLLPARSIRLLLRWNAA